MTDLPTLDRQLARDPGLRRRLGDGAPPPGLLELPEKAVQFGTGAFLRGFVEYFVDEANRQGRFGGRIVMIGSTGSGRDRVLGEQDGLYTLSVQGMEEGVAKREHRVISSVSRAISSRTDWEEALRVAREPALELVFSNTTEVGIRLDEEDRPDLSPPRSFPGKLARFLLERARAFDHDAGKGVVVIPCELIEDNGDRLKEIVLALAGRWGLEPRFARWVEEAVPFCNTLVDRIVPGTPGEEALERHYEELGYRDGMLTECEVYRLFAIQGDAALAERLGFAAADPGIVVTDDVSPYRERKVRLLNGAHTIIVPAALLCGLETVREAVEDERVGAFLRRVLLQEMVPTLRAEGAEAFARAVLDRFANPYIRHALLDITLQSTMKMRVRVVPTLLAYAEQNGEVPESIAFGFAAFLLFMRGEMQEELRAAGRAVPSDDRAEDLRRLWAGAGDDADSLAALVRRVCADRELWGADLTEVPGFAESVAGHLGTMRREGVPAALDAHLESVAA
jgi:tagaturonate reductase